MSTENTVPSLSDAQWYDLASRHANADWNNDGYLSAVKALCADFASVVPSPAVSEGDERAAFEAWYAGYFGGTTHINSIFGRDAWNIWKAALAHRPAPIASTEEAPPQSEPVAWKHKKRDWVNWFYSEVPPAFLEDGAGAYESIPLYADQLPAQPVLTDADRQRVLEEACAAIKAEDDRQADNGYMLDSDDCIQVIRALLAPQPGDPT